MHIQCALPLFPSLLRSLSLILSIYLSLEPYLSPPLYPSVSLPLVAVGTRSRAATSGRGIRACQCCRRFQFHPVPKEFLIAIRIAHSSQRKYDVCLIPLGSKLQTDVNKKCAFKKKRTVVRYFYNVTSSITKYFIFHALIRI